jgi:hypothetical protein
LSMPESFATMGQKQALFVIADIDLGSAAQIISAANIQKRTVKVCDHEQSMFESVLAMIQPANGDGSSWGTKRELLLWDTHPTMTRFDLLPVVYLLAPGTSSATRIILGTYLIPQSQRPIQSVICAKTSVHTEADVFALPAREVQCPFQRKNGILQHILAQLIARVEQRTEALIVFGGSNTT